MFSIAGKKALVTGGSGCIGQAIAQRFAAEGATCVLAGRSADRLVRSIEKLASLKPKGQLNDAGTKTANSGAASTSNTISHSTYVLDVQGWDRWRDLAAAHPDIDILVNCAGVARDGLLVRQSLEDIETLLATNLQGAIWGCRAVGKRMMANREGGCIINVSSVLAQKGKRGVAVYAASKAGLVGLTTSLAVELGECGIRVNAVLPGYIESEMTKDIPGSPLDSLTKRIPLRRQGTVDEVADAVAFLAKNPYANNCILHLDGGLSAA